MSGVGREYEKIEHWLNNLVQYVEVVLELLVEPVCLHFQLLVIIDKPAGFVDSVTSDAFTDLDVQLHEVISQADHADAP